ncbi:sulfurtransferase [Halobacterium salinarum]|uniref:Rhodanese domain protein n=3 Tax=Halobacterium salinarum TaxID=2242 RepID=Q9HMT6_HALSA|nr:sulfurtransferase [Halobacterium salinarum]AAG20485.1 thiosulfate sulfurtransferase [Halobacterium salinarum NRC-1]MBB6089584.1 thiosulfate/3-mercaptopyruvate sulfurtransferase [Halobacterium salinarum]MDL0118468.1 sulfurtransferase [Halobacterium salinarum]MDL0131660.1 sulfurtransferase [Halobacterium salinarum]MDL0138520.1 sulfurtransferase [Halobacterium salinarum]
MSDNWVVTPDWLDEQDDASVRVVDVRDAWEYDGIGHVPGAVNVPFDAFRSADGPQGMLPPAGEWAAVLSAAGVERGDTLVAYDDTHGVFAARFLVTALYHGHDDVAVLDGDYSAWVREHETTTGTPEVDETTYEPGERGVDVFVGTEAVADAAASDAAVVVDTRDPGEFADGHIPDAVNVTWTAFVDDDTRGLKSRAAIEDVLAEHGITREDRVVLYCNTARRISHTFVVLRWLGFTDVSFYEGSVRAWTAAGRSLV